MTKNSNTKSKDTQSDSIICILHLSNGTIVIGTIVEQDEIICYVNFPLQLKAFFGDEGEFEGFNMMPYLMPFVDMNLETIVNFNINQVVSTAMPAQEILNRYLKIYNNINSDDEIDLSDMEISKVKH